jgi:DNA mismatch repair protein MutL
MGKIVLLDELTINQIAAGEVIERPASVVKEMVENSIDAGATNIVVEIKNGGISFIRVSDNGKGIAQDDLEIAFERHATSKIRSAADLDTVTSMGFRGEALASIAAVANVELVSKTQEQEIGYRVVVEAGDILEKEEMGCRTGTTITVRNLFFNTPVRYKFLKKDYTESGYIEDVITRIALVNPNVAIKLISTGKTVIQTNGNGNLKDVVYSIYGKDIANGIMEVSYNFEDIEISGVIGKPEIARSNRTNQLFFVNKRYIKDKTLTSATEQAYKGLIPIGKFGFVILNLKMNPAKVDVNVHPAKLEVRFQEENKVFQAVYHAIKDILLKSELVKDPVKEIEENKNRIDRSAVSFEERLRNLRESKKENSQNGLFGFRKQHEKEIEEYNEQESKIKTNNIIEDVYKNNTLEKASGKPIDTTDVLEKLREMKQKIENEISNNDTTGIIKLNEESSTYGKENNTVNNIEKSEAQTEKRIEDNQENVANTIKIQAQENIEGKEAEEVENKNESAKPEQLDANIKAEENSGKKVVLTEQEKEEQKQKIDQINEVIENLDNPELKQEFGEIKEKIGQLDDNTKVVSEDFDEMYTKLFGRAPIKEQESKKENSAIDLIKDNVSIFEKEEKLQKPNYKFVGIVFKTYIILELKDEMYILDQHAAHERIMYEKVKKNYYSNEEKDSQLLLLPDVITLTHKEMDIAKENMGIFEKAGFSLEEFGENTIKLTGVPNVCIDLDTKELFLETLDEINTVARTAKQEKEEKFIATVACKSAVKANMALTPEEVEKLMEQLLSLPNPFTCPHGRPTVIKMTKYDIERKFARK